MSVSKELGELRALARDRQHQIGDLQNELSVWQRKCVAAEKAAAKAELLKSGIAALEEEKKRLEGLVSALKADNGRLQAKADRVNQVLDDVAALKRLVG